MKKVILGERVSKYELSDPAMIALCQKHGIPSKFEALSIAIEGSQTQLAIIPLDESSRENAEMIVKLWNERVDYLRQGYEGDEKEVRRPKGEIH